MIVRILGEGQYELSDAAAQALDPLDATLNEALESGDEHAFEEALCALLKEVRAAGSPLDAARIVPSQLTLPHEGSTLAELRALLASEPEAEPETVGKAEGV